MLLDKIEPLLPALAPRSSVPPIGDGDLVDRAVEMTSLLRDIVRCSAFTLTAWDPVADTHLHRTIASDGYTPETLVHVNDDFVANNRAFLVSHLNDPRAIRWRECRDIWNFEFGETLSARKFLIPAGFREGLTMCLRLPNGRYTGAFHMSWSSAAAATDDRRDIAERFRPIFAELCDRLRGPQLLAETIPTDAGAMIFYASGLTFPVYNRQAGPHLEEGGGLRELLLSRPLAERPRRFLWPDADGRCHRVSVTPCHGEMFLVGEELIAWPYGLSVREIEILELVSEGHSNPAIAARLFVSTRTVSTHVEHILSKMGCASRARLAALVAAEGLRLPHVPFRSPARRTGFRSGRPLSQR